MQPLVQGYDELLLRFDRRDHDSHHVFASTRTAQASTDFELPFNELEIENFVLRVSRPRGRRRIDSSAMGDARRFGAALFEALFGGEVRALYRGALADARRQGRGVRITLGLSNSPELIDVPWEYLFDDPDFLAVSAFTPVVRYLDLPRAHRPLPVEPPLRVLGVVSSPAEYEQLDVDSERDNLTGALSELIEAGAVELHWLERPTLGAMLKALQAQPFHALHYIGHGVYDRDAERGLLLFEDEGGWAQPVSGDRLGMILHDFWSLRLAVLNACEGARTGRTDPFAGVAGSLVQRDIPAVVAMQFEISDEAAIVFAGGFYRPLAAGVPVDASIAAARLAMLAERGDDIEWGTPVLFMRVPDGRIFDLGDQHDPVDATQIVEIVAAAATPAGEGGQQSAASAEAGLASASPSLGSGLSDNRSTPASGASTAIAPEKRRVGHRHRYRLLIVGALAVVLAVAVGASALGGGGFSVARQSFTTGVARQSLTTRAGPFGITYDEPWRPQTTAVTGTFALTGSSARSGAIAAIAGSLSARLVSGTATLAAGELATSASIPGGAPPALLSRYGRPIESADAQIAGHRGRRYTWSSPGRRVVAYVLPTSTGDGAIICQAPTSVAAALQACGALAARAHASGDGFLTPGPDHALALAITGALKAVSPIRTSVPGLRGPLPARAQTAAAASRTETRASAILAKLAPPARYQHAIAWLTRALVNEAAAFNALAGAARSGDRTAYSDAVRRVSTASRAMDAATRRLGSYHLGVTRLHGLRLHGPPATANQIPTVTPTAQASTTTAVAPPPPSSPAPSGGGGSGATTSFYSNGFR